MAAIGNVFTGVLANPEAAGGLALEVFGAGQKLASTRAEAELFQNQASQIRAIQSFNDQLTDVETQRRQEQLTRDLSLTLGRQQVQTGVSGLETTSKSFLQLRNEALSEFSRAMLQDRSDAELSKRVSRFQSESAAFQSEAQSRAVRTRGRQSLLSSSLNIGSQISDLSSLNPED